MSTWTDQNKLFIDLPLDTLLTILMYGEAGNQDVEGMSAVINVVRNRTLDKSFYDMDIYNMTGDAYKAVILKKWQFSMFNLNDPVRAKAENWAKNIQAALSGNVAFQQAYNISQMVLAGTLDDNTGGSTFYYNPAGVSQEPQWASVIPFITQIGDHLFFGEGVSAAISSVTATFEETAQTAVETIKEYPNITVLVLAGLGVGLLLELRKRKR
jgi:hypothetical protein